MYKTITTIVLTVLAVLFGIQNFNHVPVYLIWGKPVNIHLIFVIAISGVCGYLIRLFIGISREDALKKKLRAVRMNSMNNHRKKKGPDDLEEEEY